jgi:hypothetical protein
VLGWWTARRLSVALGSSELICTTPEFDGFAKEVGLKSHRAGVSDAAGRARLRVELDGLVAGRGKGDKSN